ncbi:MAG: J domain-containing protein [Legionella sp.]|uniref:J domain-containing protein n=1 Tax=Legionella sp. TaxID=459 RepID=UPI0039E24967
MQTGPSSTEDVIKKQFRKLALLWHPDKHSNKVMKSVAEMVFKLINTAHEILSNSNSRKNYDATISLGLGQKRKKEQPDEETFQKQSPQWINSLHLNRNLKPPVIAMQNFGSKHQS